MSHIRAWLLWLRQSSDSIAGENGVFAEDGRSAARDDLDGVELSTSRQNDSVWTHGADQAAIQAGAAFAAASAMPLTTDPIVSTSAKGAPWFSRACRAPWETAKTIAWPSRAWVRSTGSALDGSLPRRHATHAAKGIDVLQR